MGRPFGPAAHSGSRIGDALKENGLARTISFRMTNFLTISAVLRSQNKSECERRLWFRFWLKAEVPMGAL